jgi:hypothetical protein
MPPTIKRSGKIVHAKYALHDKYIGQYIGNERGFPVYHFQSGSCHSFDADEIFADVPGQEWVEEFNR